jgi:hypothetical protein
MLLNIIQLIKKLLKAKLTNDLSGPKVLIELSNIS